MIPRTDNFKLKLQWLGYPERYLVGLETVAFYPEQPTQRQSECSALLNITTNIPPTYTVRGQNPSSSLELFWSMRRKNLNVVNNISHKKKYIRVIQNKSCSLLLKVAMFLSIWQNLCFAFEFRKYQYGCAQWAYWSQNKFKLKR